MRIVNFYTVEPNDLQAGDVLLCTVKLHVSHRTDNDGNNYFRMYRCLPGCESDGMPQGNRIGIDEDTLAQSLFPVVKWAKMNSEP